MMIPTRLRLASASQLYVRLLVPSKSIVHRLPRQLTRGKSGQLFQPGVVFPVASSGAPVAGFDFPLATKYGNDPVAPLRKFIYNLFSLPGNGVTHKFGPKQNEPTTFARAS